MPINQQHVCGVCASTRTHTGEKGLNIGEATPPGGEEKAIIVGGGCCGTTLPRKCPAGGTGGAAGGIGGGGGGRGGCDASIMFLLSQRQSEMAGSFETQ